MEWVLKWKDIKHRLLLITGIVVVIAALLLLFDLLAFRRNVEIVQEGVLYQEKTKEVVDQATIRLEGKMDQNLFFKEGFRGTITITPETDDTYTFSQEVELTHLKAGNYWVLGGGYVSDGAPHIVHVLTDEQLGKLHFYCTDADYLDIVLIAPAENAEEAETIKRSILLEE